MAPVRMIDLLKQAQRYHKELRDFFEAESQAEHSEDVKTLLRYISRHEDILEKGLAEYEAGASPQVIENWLEGSPDFSQVLHPDKSNFRPDMTTEEVIEQTLKLDDCLVRMYDELRQQAVSQDLKDALTNLLEREKQEETRIMRAALEV